MGRIRVSGVAVAGRFAAPVMELGKSAVLMSVPEDMAAAIQAVFQFTDIPRPVVSQQCFHGVITQFASASGRLRDTLQKIGGQERNVLTPLAQRGDAQAEHIQTKE